MLPESVDFIDVSCSNDGTSNVSSNNVSCSWHILPVGNTDTMTIRALATQGGVTSNAASVSSGRFDRS